MRVSACGVPAHIRSSPAFAAPLALTTGLLALTLLPRLRVTEALTRSVWSAAAGLLVWMAVLALRRRSGSAALDIIVGKPRTQHYVQGLCQPSIYAIWGWYRPPVYDFVPLLVAQLLFAYIFEVLLAWSRRRPYLLGLGPFPIVFSTNLFLWFKDEWFAL